MEKLPLSVCLIVKDEADIISFALESIKDIASEIIVLDTGSADNTVEIVKQYGARVFHYAWNNDFSAARNESLKYATQEWVLVFAADFIFDEASKRLLTELLSTDTDIYYVNIIENKLSCEEIAVNQEKALKEISLISYKQDLPTSFKIYTNQENQSTRYIYSLPLLFRNGKNISFKNRVFESINTANLKTGISGITIRHYDYTKNLRNKKAELKRRIISLSLNDDLLPPDEKLFYKMLLLHLDIEIISSTREKLEELKAKKQLSASEQVLMNQLANSYSNYLTKIKQQIEKVISEGLIASITSHYNSYEFIYNDIAEFLFKHGFINEGFSFTEKALKKFPDLVKLWFMLASGLSASGRVIQAGQIFNNILKILEKPAELIRAKTEIMLLEPDHINYLRARISYELSDYASFTYYFEQIKYKDEYMLFYQQMNNQHQQKKQLNYLKGISGNALLYLRLAREFRQFSDYKQTLENYYKAIAGNDPYVMPVILMDMLEHAKSLCLSEKEIGQISDKLGNNAYCYYGLGHYYLSTGEVNKALEYFKKVTGINDQFLASQINKSLKLGEMVITTSIFTDSDFNAAVKYFRNKSFAKAQEIFLKLAENPLEPYYHYVIYDYIALIYEYRQEHKKAYQALRIALKSFDDFYLKARMENNYNLYFEKIMQQTYNVFPEFKTKQIPEEFTNVLKEIDKLNPGTILISGEFNQGAIYAISLALNNKAILVYLQPENTKIIKQPDHLNDYEPERLKPLTEVVQSDKQNDTQVKCFMIKEKPGRNETLAELEELLPDKKADVLFFSGEFSYTNIKHSFLLYSALLSEQAVVIFNNIIQQKDKLTNQVDRLWKELIISKPTREYIYSDSQPAGGIGVMINLLPEKKIYDRYNIAVMQVYERGIIRAVYEDNIRLLLCAFAELGIDCLTSSDELRSGYNNILMIPYSTPQLSNYLLDYTYFNFQLEQLTIETITTRTPYYYHSYLRLLKNAVKIWDFSRTNINFLRNIGLNNTVVLPFGFHEKMHVLDFKKAKTIDILFYGELNERRINILNQLSKKGYRVTALQSVFGEARYQYIEKAKIVLNIGRFANSLLEHHRLSFLINNRCFVISEISEVASNIPDNLYEDGIVLSAYDKIVQTCEFYLKPENESLRQNIADKGYQNFYQHKMADKLKDIL